MKIDFRKLKKSTLTIELNDEEHTRLFIYPPSKKILDDMAVLEAGDENEGNPATLDEEYRLIARAMSRNKNGIEITKEKVEEMFDIEDVAAFFTAYYSFLAELSKN